MAGDTGVHPPRIGLRPGYRKPAVVPIPGEHTFRTEELFFSTTNLKGIIQTGNEVFVRISLYSRDDLIGAPHNIIRHPDMPRLVFKTLWDVIESGRPISAFVKNLARDGKAYWVLANVFPVLVDGKAIKYISVRTRPLSPVFGLIPGLYAALRSAEVAAVNEGAAGGGIEASLDVLQQALTSHGFRDYFSFMSHVLMEESRALMEVEDTAFVPRDFRRVPGNGSLIDAYLTCRRATTTLSLVLRKLDVLRDAIGRIERLRAFTRSFAYRVKLLSLNTVLTASAAGREGTSIGVIARDILECSGEIEGLEIEFDGLASSSTGLLEETINGVVFVKFQLLMIFRFLEEVLVAGTEGAQGADADHAENARDLLYVLVHQLESVTGSAQGVQELFGRLLAALVRQGQAVRRLMSAQNFGRIQSVHTTRKREALQTLFQEIRACGDSARETVDDLSVEMSYTEKCFQDITTAVARVNVDAGALGRLLAENR